MIHDSIGNASRYKALHPRFEAVFAYLQHTDLGALPVGKRDLCEGVKLIVERAEGRGAEDSLVEAHRAWIDIQLPLEKTEEMGYVAAENLREEAVPYDAEKDIVFYKEKATSRIRVKVGEMAIFFAGEGHQPCLMEGQGKKIIVKVAAD